MSLAIKISVDKNTTRPALEFLRANLTPQRLAQEIGPRATTLVRKNFWNKGKNKKGWPSTHFWLRAAEATTWQEQSGFVTISVDKVGVRQRLLGGDIHPVNARALTIPARADAYGKRARDFNNLRFAFVRNTDTGAMCAALVEAQPSTSSKGTASKSGPATQLKATDAVFWLSRGVRQDPDPTVLPTDDAFGEVIEQSVEALLANPHTN